MIKRLLAPALEALRIYWPALLLLQLCAGAVAIGYFNSAGFREIAAGLMEYKKAGGIWFVIIANILSGGVVPELLKWKLRPPGRKGPGLIGLIHLFGLMALLGVGINAFYAFQGVMFGSGPEPWRIAVKILADQGAYTPLVVTPTVILWYAWKEFGYSWARVLRELSPREILRRSVVLYTPNLMFWFPCLVALYSLPTELQFLLFLFLNAAWCILMVFIAQADSGKAQT